MPPENPAAPAPLDCSAIAEMAGGNADAQRRLLRVFADAQRVDAADLERAIRGKDKSALARAAHRMMGASRIVGAEALAAACDQILLAAQAGDWSFITSHRAVLERELELVRAYVVQLLEERPRAGEPQ